MDRQASIHRLQTEEFDLCIIGGGASGAGCALDAALRGLKVALVEKTDFAAETSSKSTKLIHGGVRYLEQAFKKLDFGQLRQVRHGLEERHILLRNAPHLARPLALVTPVANRWEGLYFRIGLWLYDRFASGSDSLPKSRWLTRAEACDWLPGLNPRLYGAVLYYDGQLDDARYCLALAQSAAKAGAVVANYIEVMGFEKNSAGGLEAATLQDRLAGPPQALFTLRALCFLNCTGARADAVRRLANPALPLRIRPSKGVHLMLPLSVLGNPDAALLIPKTPDGRVVFAIPFQGVLLLGTTDQDEPEPGGEPQLEAGEVDFLLRTLQPYINRTIEPRQVTAGFGGLRPLLLAKKKYTKGLVRDHEVEQDVDSGLFSLLGGKWTTYRRMAQDAVDAVCRQLGRTEPCSTADYELSGAANPNTITPTALAEQFGFEADIARHLVANYGSAAAAVAEMCGGRTEWRERLAAGHPFIGAEVAYAVHSEMACTLRDMLARRIRLEILDWQATLAAIPATAAIMAETLGWAAADSARYQAEYRQQIENFMVAAKGEYGWSG